MKRQQLLFTMMLRRNVKNESATDSFEELPYNGTWNQDMVDSVTRMEGIGSRKIQGVTSANP